MRAAAIQQTLREHETDAILITSYENRRYVTGFTGSDGLALITQDEAVLFVDGRYTLQAAIEVQSFSVTEFQANPYKLLKDYNFKNVYIEDKSLPIADYKKLKELLPNTSFHSGSWLLDDMRKTKTSDEVDRLRISAGIADAAFSHILKHIREGVTEKEIALELEYFMRLGGAMGISFDTIAAASARAALPHAQPTERKIEGRDILLMDFGCIYEGYCSDITRTVFVGEPSKEQIRVYETVFSAQKAALSVIRQGVLCSKADKAARDIIIEAGYGSNFSHSLGHGVGLNVHELPVLSQRSTDTLKAGNAVTVEPGIYLQNKFGVRIEDLVIVTEDGCENLTKSNKELTVI